MVKKLQDSAVTLDLLNLKRLDKKVENYKNLNTTRTNNFLGEKIYFSNARFVLSTKLSTNFWKINCLRTLMSPDKKHLF